MESLRRLLRRIRLRHLIFLLLLVSGLIPLATISALLTKRHIEILETQEQTFLTRSARDLSQDLSSHLETVKHQVRQLGQSFLLAPGPPGLDARLREGWAGRLFTSFLVGNRGRIEGLRVLAPDGSGPWLGADQPSVAIAAALDNAFTAALEEERSVYRFVRSPDNRPLSVVAVPIRQPTGEDGLGEGPVTLVLEAVIGLAPLQQVFQREAQGEVGVFLVDAAGHVLWAEGADEATSRALASSSLVQDFRRKPLNLTAEYTLYVRGEKLSMLGRVSPVPETGWGVVVHKPLAAAYVAVEQLVYGAVISTLVLVLLALVFGALAAKRFSDPIQALAETTHEIAAGNFQQRVQASGPGLEIADLARDFNRMVEHVEGYVEQLQAAAEANRELFVSSIRAFAAAVDAKDPYTRGHSERVATYSRVIARTLGQSDEFQERIWIAGVLHDVGKIGVEDHILKKGGVLTADEYELMKLHPVIGADILSPIELLREMLPAVRWHHEAWNGRGYPDGLKGEEIPLIARIVGVADTFDAITTTRPYQKAYTTEYAVETITKLTGARFDAKVVTAFLRAFQEGQIEVQERRYEAEEEAVGA